MKKILLLLTLFCVILLCACNDTTSEFNISNPDVEQFTTDGKTLTELKEMYLHAFNQNDFITENKQLQEKYTNLGYEISTNNNMRKTRLLGTTQVYYYPIEIENTLFYLDNTGRLCIGEYIEQIIDNIHLPNNFPSKFTIICNSPEKIIILKENAIETYSFGTLINSIAIPNDWDGEFFYCGYSYSSGYIFRNSNNVYAIDLGEEDADFYLIATNVKTVIDADYEYTVEAWSSPLFLMEDGTIQVYAEWDGNLYPISSDGEWNDVHTPHIPYEYMN